MTAALIILFGGLAALVLAAGLLVLCYTWEHVNNKIDMMADLSEEDTDNE